MYIKKEWNSTDYLSSYYLSEAHNRR